MCIIKVAYLVYGMYIYVLLRNSFPTQCLQINIFMFSSKTFVGLFFKVYMFDTFDFYFHIRNELEIQLYVFFNEPVRQQFL